MKLENITVTQIILYTTKLLAQIEAQTKKHIPSFEGLKERSAEKGFPNKFLLRSAIIRHLDKKLGENDSHIRNISTALSVNKGTIIDVRTSHTAKRANPRLELYFEYLELADSLGQKIPFEKEIPPVKKSQIKKKEQEYSNSIIMEDHRIIAEKILSDLLVFSKKDTLADLVSSTDRGYLASFRTFAIIKFQKSFPNVSYKMMKILFTEIGMHDITVDLKRHETLCHKINNGDPFAQWHRQAFRDFMTQ